MTDVVVVMVTAPSMEKAAEIGRSVVEERLAACANLVPGVRSLYVWEGKFQDEGEVLMILKTRQGLFEALRARIAELHPYQVPEVLRLDVAEGHVPYVEWVLKSVR